MNIYRDLTRHIQNFFRSLKKQNIFYQRIFDGSLTAPELTRFLQNVSFLTAHTPAHLKLAHALAKTRGEQALARYFAEKLDEEVGHDQWGTEDVAALQKNFHVSSNQLGIVPAMQALVAGNEAMIRSDPFHYFIYVLYAEYFTVIAGPESLTAIEKNKGIPKSMMTIIGKHAELDQHHVAEWATAAEEVGLKAERCTDYREVLDGIMERYTKFCEDLIQFQEKAA